MPLYSSHIRPRRGTTLVEMAVVIAVEAVLLGLGVGLIGRLLLADQASRGDFETLLNIDALSDQFCRDVHAANGLGKNEDDESASILRLQLSDRQVSYVKHERQVVRQEIQDGNVLHREGFHVPRQCEIEVQADDGDPQKLLRLVIAERSNSGKTPRRQWTWEAILGRDRAVTAAKGSTP